MTTICPCSGGRPWADAWPNLCDECAERYVRDLLARMVLRGEVVSVAPLEVTPGEGWDYSYRVVRRGVDTQENA